MIFRCLCYPSISNNVQYGYMFNCCMLLPVIGCLFMLFSLCLAMPGLSHPSPISCKALFVAIDETVWHADYQLLAGFRNGKKVIVGGHWSQDAEEDFSALEVCSDLPNSKLSKMSCNYIIARVDGCPASYDMCFLPCMQGSAGKTDLFFTVLGQILFALTKANSGKPPQGYAFDAGTCNYKMMSAALGLLPPSEMVGPFWSRCQVEALHMPMMPFGVLKYNSFPILGSLDCLHTLKRWTIQHSLGSRTVHWGSCWVDYWGMLDVGMPLTSYVIKDPQSDQASFQRLNPRFLTDRWDSAGSHIQMVVASLISSCWELRSGNLR